MRWTGCCPGAQWPRVCWRRRGQIGIVTTVDMVSTENSKFRAIAEAALPFTDYLLINEIEAGKIVGCRPAGCVGDE